MTLETVGRYKLLQQIGEGGFGVVYQAEQTEPVRRKVALKILKRGMDTRQVVARFEAERQALALMDHPNIAKVLDAGTTDDGRPYFVMELVKGIPVTAYCDQVKLDTVARLQLFQQICHAVQHAHQKGIIHRDLKPANILVALHDGAPVPKVIDFGIAKATDHRLTEKTLFTDFHQMIGTPEYMAPEQAEMSGLDVDTRADIYSLGILLYELLTGTKPFDLRALLQQGYEEMLRNIREVDPPRPSTRVSTLGEQLVSVAAQRHVPPRVLGTLLRGDLDWIVMKAIQKDRSRRYETANAFALDIQRYMDDEPVEAARPSRAYRARKYVRRHKLGVASAAILFLALLVGAVLSFSGYAEAAERRERATLARATAAREAKTAQGARVREAEQRKLAEAKEGAARVAAREAKSVLDLIQRMLTSAVPPRPDGREYTVRELLDDFDRGVGTSLQDQPEIEASVRTTIGTAYRNLGLFKKSARHLKRALALREQLQEDAPLAHCLNELGMCLTLSIKPEQAERMHRRALAIYRDLGNKAGIRACLHNLANAIYLQNRFDEAEKMFRELLAVKQGGETLLLLAAVLRETKRFDEARELMLEAIDVVVRDRGQRHPHVATAYKDLAELERKAGRLDEAEAAARKSVALVEEALGKDSVLRVKGLSTLALVLESKGAIAEADNALREIVRLTHKTDDRVIRAFALNSLGVLRRKQGDFAAAERHLRESLAIRTEVLGKDHAHTAVTLDNLGVVLAARGNREAAEKAHRSALAVLRKRMGDKSLNVATCLSNLALVLQDKAEAERMLREVLEIRKEIQGVDHAMIGITLSNLGSARWRQGDPSGAAELFRKARKVLRAKLGDDHHSVGRATGNLALMLYDMGQYDAAVPEYREAIRIQAAVFGDRHHEVVKYRARLAFILLRQEDYAGAEECARKLLAAQRSDAWLALLATCLVEQGKYAEAEPVARECLAIRKKKIPGTWLHYNAMSVLGGALAGQSKYSEAEPLLLEGFEKMSPPAQSAIRKRQALERVIKLYDAWRKPEQAAAWRAKVPRAK